MTVTAHPIARQLCDRCVNRFSCYDSNAEHRISLSGVVDIAGINAVLDWLPVGWHPGIDGLEEHEEDRPLDDDLECTPSGS